MAVQLTYPQDMALAFKGLLGDANAINVRSMVNKEVGAGVAFEIPFGHAVAFEGATFDKGALLPDALVDVIAGIVAHSHAYSNSPGGDLGVAGVKPDGVLNVLRKGVIWAVCEDGCAPGDRLFVAIGTGADAEGALRSTADGVNTIDSTGQGQWLTTAAAGGLARLEVDFTNLPV